jgi:hypothetical protein
MSSLGALVLGLVIGVVDRLLGRRRDRARSVSAWLRWSQLGLLVSLIAIVMVIAVNIQAEGGEFFFGVPPAMAAGLVGLWGSLAGSVVGLIGSRQVWAAGGHTAARLTYVLGLVGTAGALAFAAEWRWLGWWT